MRPLLKAYEVAELLGRSTRWVLDAAVAGDLPSFKVGKAVRFDEDEIEAWLTERRRGERVRPSSQLHVIGGNK
jgi:excisionase family DNA binding protein